MNDTDNMDNVNKIDEKESDCNTTKQKFDVKAFLAQRRGWAPSDLSKNLDDLMNSKSMKAARDNLEEVMKSEKVKAVKVTGIQAMDKGMRKVFGLPTRSDELNILGMEELKVGRYMSALAYFKDALKKNHDNVYAKENIEKTLLAIKDISMKTMESLDHEAAKTITEIAVLEDQATSVREHMELIEDLIKSKREYLQNLTDKYNKINQDSSN